MGKLKPQKIVDAEAMAVEQVRLDALHPDPANVRVHSARNLDAIKASLARFGQQKPIVVDGDGIVRAGNGTLAAAKGLGWSTIAVVRTPLRGAEAIAFAIADNRTAELAEWDETGLAETLRALQSEPDFAIEATGYTDDEIDALLGQLANAIVPDFQPASENGQSRLDEKAKVECPECGHHFTP